MKTVGIVGGIGPESTIDYYRSILAGYRQRKPHAPAPPIVITSIDVGTVLDLAAREDRAPLAEYILVELHRLARAGADFAALASNTPHIVFDRLARESPLPLISIVEAACDAVASAGLRRVALFGTKFTMTGGFYGEVFSRRGLEVVIPSAAERELIHSKYVGELLNNLFLPETRSRLLAIVRDLRDRNGIEGVILGGTELPLLLKDESHEGLRLFDTTRIHVHAIVNELS